MNAVKKIKEITMLNKLLKFATKYWLVLSAIITLLISMITGGLKLKGMIDQNNATILDLQQQVKDLYVITDQQDKELDDLDHRVIPLEVKDDLREKGLLK